MKKKRDIDPEQAMKQVQKIFKQRGTKALELARKEALNEKIECNEVREALNYFMTKYWKDLGRPSLMSLVCEAVGGNPELTIPIAVPMSLISGAIDIHDDIIDQSKIKNDKPTVYGKYGKDIALLVGDALLFKGFSLLHDGVEKGVPAEVMCEITTIVKETFFELGDAEALELGFRGRVDVSVREYLDVIRKKAADVEAHTRISALLGGGSKEVVEDLGKYGRLLGMLLILRDDWIDMVDPEESLQRIQKECIPLPILYALQDTKIKSQLASILQKGRVTKKDVEKILAMIEESEAPKKLWKLMNELSENTILNLGRIKTNGDTLETLVRSVVPSKFDGFRTTS